MIDLTIKTLDSQNHKFRVPDTFTILELKEHIADQVNVEVAQQRLIFCGRVLSNETKLADIGIDGKVMHLVQKVPRLTTTTTGSSSTTTTTNTNSRVGPGFRGYHTHGHDPTVLFGAIGIPTELMHTYELPRFLNARNQGGIGARLSLAMDMIRRSNEILNRLENPGVVRPSAADVQFPEGLQQTEDTSGNVPESSEPPIQSDPDSVNVSYEVDETFPNTVVVTIDATHTMRMPPGLMRQMQNRLQGNNSPSQNATEQSAESEAVSAVNTPTVSANQSLTEQATGESLPSSTSTEQNLRNVRQTSETRSSASINDRHRLKELIDQLNRLNTRLEPFSAQYCQYVNEDPQFESTEGDNGSNRAQVIFNGVSEVMHLISHVYHAISDLRFTLTRPPPRTLQSRSGMLQGHILHQHQTITTSATPPPPHLSTQLPISTQTTSTNPTIPVVPIGVDLTNLGGESPNVSTSAASPETNSNMSVDPNTESNTTLEFLPEAPNGVDIMFDLTPGSIRIDSVETYVSPTESIPGTVIHPSNGNETPNHLPMPMPMPLDWMDQMIDVISSGVRRPLMSDQPLDWNSIPTTSTRTPRVTPRTTDSSSTTNSPPQVGLSRGRWDSSRMDPFLPCSSHHFESSLRPMVLARRSTLGTDRSTSSANSGNSTTDTSTPSSPIDLRPFPSRRSGRPRTRFATEPTEGFTASGLPILAWGRSRRSNSTTIPPRNITPITLQNSVSTDSIEQLRVDLGNAYEQLETEMDLDRARTNMGPEVIQPQVARRPALLLITPIGQIPYFRALEGRSILVDLFLLIARNWTLFDMLNLNTANQESTIAQNSISRNSDVIENFILERIMHNEPSNMNNIEEAANRLYLELLPFINMFESSVPTRTNVNVGASFLRCITQNLRGIVNICEGNRAGASNNIVLALNVLAKAFVSLIVYCCTNSSIFRLCVSGVLQLLPIPSYLRDFIMSELRLNIDRYWTNISSIRAVNLSVVDYIVPASGRVREFGQTSRVITQGNTETSTNPTLPSPEIIDEPLPEVVIGSQEWHHSVPSNWVPVITRDSQRQRRQGTQPPYSDAYLSGMPNKRRKIVTNSKPQGSLSQIIAKNLEVAMGAAGVTIKKEVTATVGADTEVQSAYTERIKTFGRSSGLDTHPDYCPNRYPNASKFFYDHNQLN